MPCLKKSLNDNANALNDNAFAMIDLVLDDLCGEADECGMAFAELAIRIRDLDALVAYGSALAFEGKTASEAS